ncbi:TPA: hypothetical protein QEM47_001673 [Pseudomonas putida]|uniref:hypothetical protein n=1 Tax=Pseudomonas putida TaxID=303 RepID=UPI000AC1A912|nr:hypothetical protein [Pseudomonas putida]MDD2116479.1 hypothetical protein [Pseudomonas putida]UPU93481.1 hypothetical protein M0766_03350 [Pseudomonas putida]HDS1728938.1 hypothetical protein [Pseudomonas putida]
MPTENRSSNAEMVRFPRELSDDLGELIAHRARVCGGGAFEIWEAICEGFGQAVTQPHPEPIAWMVGTAIWWTKEEAERDAEATGLPIVGVGPLTGAAPAEQHQGEPVVLPAKLPGCKVIAAGWNQCLRVIAAMGPLYTHAEPAEVERMKAELVESDHAFVRMTSEAEKLRAQLEERDALLRDNSGKLIRMAAHLISAPFLALQDLQDEDKKMTRARVDHAVDVADARLKDAAYELRRIADALSASAEPRVKS